MALQPLPLEGDRLVSGARRILESEEFGEAPGSTYLSRLISDFIRWLDDFFGRYFDGWSIGGMSGGEIGARIFILGIVITLVVAVVFIVVRMLPNRTLPESSQSIDDVRAADPKALMAWADEAENAGDYSRAFVLLYLVLLKLSDEEGLVEFRSDRTNWEILQTRTSNLHNEFWLKATSSARRYDEVLYGGGSVAKSEVADLRRLIEAIPKRIVEAAA